MKNERYLQQGLSINILSSDLNINKTYLSSYINGEYRMSFREWTNTLRIEYAKNIMIKKPNMIIDEIAEITGYSSRSHFTKVFSEIVGESPSLWKNKNN